MGLSRRTKIDSEEMALIDMAMEELAYCDLPPVLVGEPRYGDAGEILSPHISYLRAEQHGLHTILRGDHQMELWEETVHVLAAKKGLVTVIKSQPGDEFDDAEIRMVHSVRNAACVVEGNYYHGTVDSVGWKPRSEDWVEENTVVVYDYPPDEVAPFPLTTFYRFVPKDALTTNDLPYIESFLGHGACGPSGGYSVPATERLLLAASVSEDIDKI